MTMDTAPPDPDNLQPVPPEDSPQGDQTRRTFIRNLVSKSAYAAPVIATFSVASVAEADHKPGHSPPVQSMMGGGGDGMGPL